MRLAVMQAHSPKSDIEAACQGVERAIATAAAAEANALVVPEVFLPGYNQPDIGAKALHPDAPALQRLRHASRKAGITTILGYAEAAGAAVYNAALAIGPDGQNAANYRKIQLYGSREKAIYRSGDAYTLFDLAGHKAAMLICYDIEFAPHVAALAALGVKVILVPTANMMPFTHVVRHTVPAMAANHGMTIAYANYCGAEADLTYTGGSLIAGPHGEVLAQAGESPALLIADIPDADPVRISTQAQDFTKV